MKASTARLVSLLAALVLTVTMLSTVTMSSATADGPAPDAPSEPSAAPVASNDDFTGRKRPMRRGMSYKLNLVANDVDPNGLPLSVASCDDRIGPVGQPEFAEVDILSDGMIVLKVTDEYRNTYKMSFNCVITNGEQLSNPAKVTYKVAAPAPVKARTVKKPNRFKIYNPNPERVVVDIDTPSGKHRRYGVRYSLKGYQTKKIRVYEERNMFNTYFKGKEMYDYDVIYVRIKRKKHR